jgi:hypothetical protein
MDKWKESILIKENTIEDRAGNTHNASQIGLFFENRGKLYSRRLSQGPDLEWPINSGMHYGYRTNPFIGIPGNVVQGKITTNEEFEAVFGYHNRQLAKIAFSDNPATWPSTGWPIKDVFGNPIIKSDQDSYCVYSDSTNSLSKLGLIVEQTGYAYGVSFAKNLLFFKFDIINKGQKMLDSIYYCQYFDCNVGNVSGGDPEYADDFIGFDKQRQLVYFYDDGKTSEWTGGKTGYMGLAFLKTPKINGKEVGITDLHYNLYDDDPNIDSIQFGIMSSSPNLYNSGIGSKYFHIGSNTDLHFDDLTTIPPSGLDIVSYISSGPYSLKVGDTLTFYHCFAAGWTLDEVKKTVDEAYKIMSFNFEISKPPTTPTLTVVAGDRKATLYWDDKAEFSKDAFTGEYDFEGYRVYKSLDKGVNWELLADYDVPKDKIGADIGVRYTYTDSSIINGLEYWYCVTAYDRGDSSIQSLESPKGTTTDAKNTKSAIPVSQAIGRTPVSAGSVTHIGVGKGNYVLDVMPVDNNNLKDNEYLLGFTYTVRQEIGKPKLTVQLLIDDSSKTTFNKWGIRFMDTKTFEIYDFATGEPITTSGSFVYAPNKIFGIPVAVGSGTILRFKLMGPNPNTAPADSLPKNGDLISIAISNYCIKNNIDTVITPRPINVDMPQATSDGVIFSLKAPEMIQDLSRIGGVEFFDLTFSVSNKSNLKNDTYVISIIGKGVTTLGGYVKLLVKNSKQDTVTIVDSLLSLKTFEFNGLKGRVTFNSSTPPSPGNIYSVKSVLPQLPNLQDGYKFKINGSSVDKQKISENMNKIKVVPNPYIVSSLFEPEFGELRREPLRQIQFINLPTECTIYIFTIDADLVKIIHHNALSGTENWDLRSDGGREVAPGIYIYSVKTEGAEYLSRFAIIK